jgi:mannose-6-phosphate isomerase class I
MEDIPHEKRKTRQHLMPVEKPIATPGRYSIYPTHSLVRGNIHTSYQELASLLEQHSVVILDGYQGVFFEDIRGALDECFRHSGIQCNWVDISKAMKPEEVLNELAAPFLGGDDPLFGSRTTLTLRDLFDEDHLQKLDNYPTDRMTIYYGTGAALLKKGGFLVYADLPKNELQYRARAGYATNLGCGTNDNMKEVYKRFYFVDWVLLNRHKQEILPQISIFIDGQRCTGITWAFGDNLRESLHTVSRNLFRVRPWFEPGTWGGEWCMQHIGGLNPDVPNYAWSFELIVPENGLIFEQGGRMLEISFDFLMYQESGNILGDASAEFGTDFPIRFDFLDTFSGGNLSVQCHPQKAYAREHFGEHFTQEETYYILDAKEGATVYLGFQEDIDPRKFHNALTESFAENKAIEIEHYINKLPSVKHDFFLIPPGTVHASGINNLVLEISSTPYIFTFKMYDWVRPDLDGKPRPLNIDRAMENLCFDRKGSYVKEYLVCRPVLLEEGENFELWHLPTHENHLYDVHRIKLKRGSVTIENMNKCHVLSIVEGEALTVSTRHGIQATISYAETFVIPAAAESYTLTNDSTEEVLIVKAFVK